MVDEGFVEAFAFLRGAVGQDASNVRANLAQLGRAGCGGRLVEVSGDFGVSGAELFSSFGEAGLADDGPTG